MTNRMADLFRCLSAGVYVIGVADGATRNAFTASSVMQVSFDPLLVALAINPSHASYPILDRGRAFSINVLRSDQKPLAEHFGTHTGSTIDKLSSTPWRAGRSGAPLLLDALAYFDCRLFTEVEAGDHRLVIGGVIDGAVLSPEAQPLLYVATGDLDQSAQLYAKTFNESK
ncbi:flavin reductase domain-containing protein [Caballeronia temeraria]|uniref:Flavin reductase domain-containing protein n=1 Tax=Caballeronia temeraria TaxID=1777137 RepID=A0A158ASC6_9BURK|nr:flavin reductase family protein [Caballeronia temeraria]SAK60629.1 flavin reductase domain-containing protein [Caballeronia temeraria]